ncbi:cold shock domain-containing protein [candidate division KSB1 bacterium]|nr:cold shock domain-containing protein [candidate division KSB1 bacterium]
MKFGIVKYWQAAKGFGFVTTDDDEELFLHADDLAINLRPENVREGLRIKFDVKSDIRGDKAVNVRKA